VAELPDLATGVLHEKAHGRPRALGLAAPDGIEDGLVPRQRGGSVVFTTAPTCSSTSLSQACTMVRWKRMSASL